MAGNRELPVSQIPVNHELLVARILGNHKLPVSGMPVRHGFTRHEKILGVRDPGELQIAFVLDADESQIAGIWDTGRLFSDCSLVY